MPGGGGKPVSSEGRLRNCPEGLWEDGGEWERAVSQRLTCLRAPVLQEDHRRSCRQTWLQRKPCLGGLGGYRRGCRHRDDTVPLQYHVHLLPNLSEGGSLSEAVLRVVTAARGRLLSTTRLPQLCATQTSCSSASTHLKFSYFPPSLRHCEATFHEL